MIAVFPNLLVIGAYFIGWIPESLSWLICKNQMDRARTALVTVAKINRKDIEVNIIFSLDKIMRIVKMVLYYNTGQNLKVYINFFRGKLK